MSDYLTMVRDTFGRRAGELAGAVVYGENIDRGSCLCGVCRNWTAPLGGRMINAGNCENTHVGAGFGILRNGGTAVLVMKQLDFLLLAVDPLVNTWNALRIDPAANRGGSFTILSIVCDQGWQGPQSSFHGLAGLCSLAHADGWAVAGATEAAWVAEHEMGRPGFRIVAVSQRMFPEAAIADPAVAVSRGVFRYGRGDEATIVCFGFSLAHGLHLRSAVEAGGGTASVFSVHPVLPRAWGPIFEDVRRTGVLIALDDGKDACSLANKLVVAATRHVPGCLVRMVSREDALVTAVNADKFTVAATTLAEEVTENRQPV